MHPGLTEASRVFLAQYKAKFEESQQITLAEMDSTTKKKGGKQDMNSLIKSNEEIRNMRFHHFNVEELEEKLNTNIVDKNGLTQDQVIRKLDMIGPNKLTEKKVMPWYLIYLKELTQFLSILLMISSVLSFVVYGISPTDPSNIYLGIVLIIVVFVAATFSYYQTSKSAAIMAKFKDFIPPKALVIRDGNESSVDAVTLVPGDLVKVKGGDNIPADIRILECHEMKVNNSSLTGESEDLLRKSEKTADNPLETANLAFFGTSCTFGSGLGVVINTGDRTVIGQIASLAQSANARESLLSNEIARFVRIISTFAISCGIIFLIICIALGYNAVTTIIYAIGIITANVPEGLPVAMTVALALTAKRLASKKVLVKNLQSVETLGATSCICSDKTGTLTQNVMTVSSLWYDGGLFDASVNYQTYLENKETMKTDYDINEPTCAELIKTVALGTKAFFTYSPNEQVIRRKIGKLLNKNPKSVTKEEIEENKESVHNMLIEEENMKPVQARHTEGDASESGLIKFIQPIEDLINIRGKYPIHNYKEKADSGEVSTIQCEIPFNSFKKYNLLIRDLIEDHSKNSFLIIMKGAPERIWGRCDKIMNQGRVEPITEQWNNKFHEANETIGKNGERVLAFASVYLSIEKYPRDFKFIMKEELKNFPMENLTFIGLVALNDPPRVYVDQSVLKCRKAGIKVIMVTGDQPVTAAAIARKCNIISPGSRTNVDLIEEGMNEEEANERCDAIVIHGDDLAKRNALQEQFDNDDPEKGRFLMNWVTKDEVVFARTTPSQKLLIVDACQRSGHIVAVTGDGVNDSPAIRKANIGVAMESGADIDKNDINMIILDDDFSSIVNGIEEGRLIFDNLKKTIVYALTVNIPELIPFILYVVLAIPLALTTIMILIICVGTDMVPAVSFAYENPELDIMNRNPRNSKRDHLVTAKLISFTYLQTGIIQSCSAFFTFFIVLHDYGFQPKSLYNLLNETGQTPKSTDVYNATLSNKGNSNYLSSSSTNDLTSSSYDIRLYFWKFDVSNWSQCRFDESSTPKWWRYNTITNTQICYTAEAINYAQCAYMVAVVNMQWCELLIVKTRNLSILHQGFKNPVSIYAFAFENILCAALCYIPYLNTGLGLRMIASPHYMVLSFPFCVMMFLFDECRKYLIRRGMNKETLRFDNWFSQNVFY